jgi:SAM-dependent methyltransferase
MREKKYLEIVSYCESFLERHGDRHLGVGWTKGKETADDRYEVMLGVIKETPREISLLDFGCGASHLYEYILRRRLGNIAYSGLDLSARFLELSRRKYPHINYYNADILCDPEAIPDFDYIVLNGVFNSKCRLSADEMDSYFRAVVSSVFERARIGIAFNVMSKLVDWERADLFHLPFDVLGRFLAADVSRDFVIRHDYGLYEYTTYVYR